MLVRVLASFRCTCKLGRRKHKHKRKERKLKNSDKLSAYILVTHALPFAKCRQQIFMLLRLRMSTYAYAYRTCKHPCAYAYAYAYACVVRVNQALVSMYTFNTSVGISTHRCEHALRQAGFQVHF